MPRAHPRPAPRALAPRRHLVDGIPGRAGAELLLVLVSDPAGLVAALGGDRSEHGEPLLLGRRHRTMPASRVRRSTSPSSPSAMSTSRPRGGAGSQPQCVTAADWSSRPCRTGTRAASAPSPRLRAPASGSRRAGPHRASTRRDPRADRVATRRRNDRA